MLGVDIGCTSIKLLALSRSRHGWHLRSAAVLKRPVKADPAFAASVQQCVRTALRSLPRRERRIAVAEPATGVFSRSLQVPPVLSGCETEQWMEQEASRHLPFPAAELYFDWQRKAGSSTITLLACHRTGLDNRLAILGNPGIARIADVDALAIYRCVRRRITLSQPQLRQSATPQSVAILDMGAAGLRLHVLRDGDLHYSNEQPLPHLEVERPDDTTQALVMRTAHLLKLAQAVTPIAQSDSVILTGGYAALPGLGERLAEITGSQVSAPNFCGDDLPTDFDERNGNNNDSISSKVVIGKKVDAQWLKSSGTQLTLAFGLAMSRAV